MSVPQNPFRRRVRRPWKRFLQSRLWSQAVACATYPLVHLLGALPEKRALRLGEVLGRAGYALLYRRRRVGMRNLEIALPHVPDGERRRILLASFSNLGRTLVEVVRLARLSNEEIRRRVSYAPGALENLPANRGAIVFSAHIGNWELLALAHSLHGNPMQLVASRLGNDFYNGKVRWLRERGGNNVVERGSSGNSGHMLVDHLACGGTVGLLVDQHAPRKTGIAVPFFDKPAWTHCGPAILALRARVPMVPAFLRRNREQPGHYTIHIGEPIEAYGGKDSRERLRLMTSRVQHAVEEEIRLRPEDWLWIHRRWKRSSDVEDFYGLRRRRRRRRRKGAGMAARSRAAGAELNSKAG